MTRWLAVLLLASAGCFSVPEGSSPVRGTGIGVVVHNYALAFREFLATREPEGLLPSSMLAPLPITAAEWAADAVTSPAAVTTTIDGGRQITRVVCGATRCTREIRRTFNDELRLDQTVNIWYLRGVTTTAADDAIVGFRASTRFTEQMVSLTAATAPAGGEPWVVTTEYGFAPTDFRRSLTRVLTYPALSSDAAPAAGTVDFVTKDGRTHADYAATTNGWSYAKMVSYESLRNLTSALVTASLSSGALAANQKLGYANGFSYTPLDLAGTAEAWLATGASLIGGAVTARRDAAGWQRTIVFPGGERFKRLVDTGTYPGNDGRGTFEREIVGQIGTLRITGTYRRRAADVWELNASTNGGIAVQFTLHELELGDAFQGVWSEPDARAAAPDTASFSVTTLPDLTTRMLYTYDRSDTPFTPDESGTLRFFPDTRGSAKVSVVKEVSGAEERHADYQALIVAEGQATD